MWPFIDQYVKGVIKQSVEPSIAASLPDYLKSFRFEKVDLGTMVRPLVALVHWRSLCFQLSRCLAKPVRIGSVKCYDENTSREEIILDIEIM